MYGDDRPADRPWASVPISAIEHFAYCRRQAALIHLDRYFSDNAETQRGHLAHEVVDRGGPSVSRDGTRCWHALSVADEDLGVHGICDVVELHPDGPVPIEHKSGSYRPGSATDLQVAAQAVCLRTMFDADVPRGLVFAGRNRRRFEVVVDDALVSRLRAVVEDLRAMLRTEKLPPPVNDRRCDRCSLRGGCMPEARRDHGTVFTPQPLGEWDA
ncbi:CRISPR-associated protein Cas4 [Saccharopolyspora endophytica]|uniref:CRISPR-associated exonuclease Cas4 n=1 Tax=Saccharopolyspora endophytica TaxID=543886 RepID=A0ABS5DQW5_9PSEU|nr:CRISPR-associated protein Cas4 [Saccharopolyspora endophytica]MBQ0928705.1 CRISPR-associated protein Cas4 [Saccharopolyspora endophytica]